jgi:20S proteasome subunit alpha 6
MYRIDDHVGIAIAGLTSDARVLRCGFPCISRLDHRFGDAELFPSNFMRQQAMSSRMVFNRPAPVNRLVSAIADSASPLRYLLYLIFVIATHTEHTCLEAQVNTQEYGRRPYGVGFLVIGEDQSGPHLYEFSPSGNAYEYYAMSIGARSQSAKTYLERHYEQFADGACSFLRLSSLLRAGMETYQKF